MADKIDKSPNFSLGELREVTLRIPGEHFFCESLSLPSTLIREIRGVIKIRLLPKSHK